MQKLELLLFLAWRDILIRYKQALLGMGWALIRPLCNMLLFVWLFQESPYFVLAGLIPWQFCASVGQTSAVSLLHNTVLIQRTSFPRVFIPMSGLIVNLLDCLLSLACFLPFCGWNANMVFFPLLVVWLVLLGLSLALWCSALAARVKDLVIAIPFLVQVGIFISPVGYTLDRFPESVRNLFLLNPLVGVIDGFRWSLLGEVSPYIDFTVPYSVGATLVLLGVGYRFFRKVETFIADTI